jgi:hypothetical protein
MGRVANWPHNLAASGLFLPAIRLAMLLLLATSLSCGLTTTEPPESPADRLSQPADVYLMNLETEWNRRVQARVKDVNDGKSKVDSKFHQLLLLLRERSADEQEKRKLIDVVSVDGMPEFADSAALALVGAFILRPDRDALVELLARKLAPSSWTIEFELSLREKPPDGFLILADAFDASQKPAVKKGLADALRRALAPLGVGSANDEEMVLASRQWYSAHKDEYIVNSDYPDLSHEPGPKQAALFLTKDEVERRESSAP